MALDVQKAIKTYIEMKTGSSIVELCEGEMDAFTDACQVTANEYWLANPHLECASIISSNGCQQEIKVNVSDLEDQFFETQELKDSAYFIGVARYEFSDVYHRYPGTYNHFDYRLLGNRRNYYNEGYINDPRYIADRVQQSVTNEDLLFGELEYRYDALRKQVIYLLPEVEGSAQIWYAWGFCPSKTLDILPANHITAYKMTAAYHFLDAMIVGRSSLSLDADYTLSTEFLQKLRDEIKEEADKAMAEISNTSLTWG